MQITHVITCARNLETKNQQYKPTFNIISMVRNFINIYNICGIYLTVKLLVILFILKSYAQISVFKPKFLRLRVVLVHNSRSNDSRSNDARFMHKLYLSLRAIKRMNTTHIALKNYKILLILIQIGINSLLEKL